MRAKHYRNRLTICPFGELDEELTAFLAVSAGRVFGLEASVGGTLPVPAAAWTRRRSQYRSGKVLAALAGVAPARAGPRPVMLGVTTVDLFTPGLNFVFGEADPKERVAVISLARLGSSGAGPPGGRSLLGERMLKEAVHELGHVFGLVHCGDPACVMHFSNVIGDTDRKGPGFCARCLALLSESSAFTAKGF